MRIKVVCGAAVASAAVVVSMVFSAVALAGGDENSSPAGDGSTETRELLAEHQTVAKLAAVAYEECRFRTALCPDNCGHSGDYATFEIVAYLSYKKPGQYGDPKAKTFSFQIDDNKKNLKVRRELARQVRSLKAGDYVLLNWRHDYVTRTEPGGGQAKFPDRPVTKVEKISKDEAEKLIKSAADGAASRPATAPASRPAGSATSQPAMTVQILKEVSNGRVADVRQKEDSTIVTITSPGGIGKAAVTLNSGKWPATIVVRLKYAAEKPFQRAEGFSVKLVDDSGKAENLNIDVPVQNAAEIVLPAIPAGSKARQLIIEWVDAYRT